MTHEEHVMEVENTYDEYLMDTEGRGISYGEIAHLESLTDDELDELCKEIANEQGEK